MDQRTLLYVSLLFMSFLIWQAWQLDHAPAPVAAQTNAVQSANGLANGVSSGEDLPEASAAAVNSVTNLPTANRSGDLITIKTDVYDLTITTMGGDVIEVGLPQYPVSLDRKDTPFTLMRTTPPRYLAQSGLIHDKVGSEDLSARAPNHYANYSAEKDRYELLDGEDVLEVVLAWTDDAGVTVNKVYTFRRGDYVIDVKHVVKNDSESDWTGRQYRQLRHGPAQDSDGSRLVYTFTGGGYYSDKFHKIQFDDMRDEPVNVEVPQDGWVSVVQHYFLSAWLPEANSANQELIYSKVVNAGATEEYILGMRSQGMTVQPGSTGTFSSRLYTGPKRQQELEPLSKGLELTIDYGIFTIFSKPIFWLLSKIHAFLGNWGWAIIILTLLIKLAFYRLSAASYRSMAKMKSAGPKLQALREKHGSDKQAQQQAMMDLYKKEKINPLGGCLPILIQIPVFIALYWVLLESVELRQAPWILWIKDLSIKDPLFILPLLMGITMFIQQKLNPPPPDPMQAKLMMALPFVFTIFFAFFPAGLVLYWVTNNVLSILQQWQITRSLEKNTAKA